MDSVSTSLSLLDGICSGHAESWERFVRVYSGVVYSKCRRHGCSEADSADITQDVFLRIHKSMGQFQRSGTRSFTRWLSTIVKHVVIDYYRKSAKTPVSPGGSGFQGLLENHREKHDDTLSFEAESDRVHVIRRTLDLIEGDFQPQTWTAFRRHGLDGSPAPDVAEELGMNSAAVRKAKSRVLARVKDELAGLI